MNAWLYVRHGIRVRHRRGAQPAGHLEPAALLRAFRGRARARAATVTAVRLQTPAGAARGWVRGITHRSAAAPLSPETGAAHGARRLADSLPAVLVEARRRPGATFGSDGRDGQGPLQGGQGGQEEQERKDKT